MPESCHNNVRFGVEDYSLYVTNLPLELNENGIEKIFKEYGTVKAIKANNEGQFAFVSYGTYAEAENAIRSLDGKAPLDLKVQFRRKRVDESKKHSSGEILSNFDPSSDSTIQQLSLPAQQEQILPKNIAYSGYATTPDSRIESLRNKFFYPQYHQEGPTMQYPMISPHFMHYPHDNMEYAATNALWLRGSMPMDAAGRKHITMGRGYTSYSIPEPRSRIISDIGKIFEKRNPGSYKYGSDECEEYFGECMKCSRRATLCCSICEGFYCSRACQIADWSTHEGKCAKIPPLVGANAHQRQHAMKKDVEPIVEGSKEEMSRPRSHDQEKIEVKQQPTLRRPKLASENKKDDSRIDNVQTTDNKTQFAAPTPPAKQQDSHEMINHDCIEGEPITRPDLKITKHEEKNITGDTSQPQSMEKIIINSVIDNFLSSSCFVAIQITAVKEAGRSFFVQKIEDAESIAQLMEKLNENIQQFMLVDKPVIGEIYGVIYDGLWYRGLVLSLDPTIVDYIDWGTVEELSMDMKQFRAIGNFAKLPRFSQLIKLSDKFGDKFKNLEIDSVISVKKINVTIENDVQVITVDVLDKSTSVEAGVIASTSEGKAKKPPSVLNYLTEGMRLVGQVADIIDKNTLRVVLNFDAIIAVFESLFTPFKDDCDKLASNYVNYEPHIDELVAVKKPDDDYWVRGCVLKYQAPNIIEIASLDEGTIITRVEKIIPLIPKYNEICIFSVIMTNAANGQSSSLPSIEIGNVVQFTVSVIKSVDCENAVEAVEVIMENGSMVTTGLQLHEWTPWKVESLKGVTTSLTETTQDAQSHRQEEEKKEKAVDDGRKHTGNMEKNISLNAKKIIGPIELENNSKVLIQSYRNPSTLFLRSLEPGEIERHNRLMQNVAKSALTSPPLASLPQSADCVLAQFMDDNYYRAMVISTEPDTQKIKIVYLDYGDVQITTLDKLKIMPESLMDEPPCVKKVRLYNIKSTPPTEEAHKWLAIVVSREEQFVYRFHSSINDEDHVVLESTTTAGTCLNDQINYLLTPTWERSGNETKTVESSLSPSTILPLARETECTPKREDVGTSISLDISKRERFFSLDDIESGKFDGNIGDTVSALFLDTIAPGYKYVFAPEDPEMIVHLTSVMPETMKKYSESTRHYIPRDAELCIALFEDGNWYRGFCLDRTISPFSASIFFLDYGNFAIVLHTNIRRMTEDFLKPKAFGCVCNVIDFTDPSTSEVSSQVLARLETLILQNETYQVEIVFFDGHEYEIKLPEIRAKLIEEGLLSP